MNNRTIFFIVVSAAIILYLYINFMQEAQIVDFFRSN